MMKAICCQSTEETCDAADDSREYGEDGSITV